MRKLIIPLYIPKENNEIDYESLKLIIENISDSIILIGDYQLNELDQNEKINILLFLNFINNKNEYYCDEELDDLFIKYFEINKINDNLYSSLGNVFFNEISEYLLNEELGVKDESLNSYLELFNNIIYQNEKRCIKYILIKQKKIKEIKYSNIDNLLGINEI